ncbi:hypothetical protein [Aureimonas glaciei]|uniref:NADH dehydrogenase subunit E n=1 Tax=Aureimonas glaciei TaxID=1776957 RepID=A0A917D8W6_9HYPH|nr:hypothetical protein [Aureimonas glaciei]GGD13051.1 hypothetical protein GCM10011335_14850 [Aureimonas glaciei]
MLTFLGRIFFLLAAGLGLGALCGRSSRHRRPLAAPPPVRRPEAGGDASAAALQAGSVAGETGPETGGLAAEKAEPVAAQAESTPSDPVADGRAEAGAKDAPLEGSSIPAVFGSFGGSAVSAAVAGRAPVDGVLGVDADIEPVADAAETGSDTPEAPDLAEPHPHGPTPPASQRAGLKVDALAKKHGSAAFDRDVKSVDFARPAGPAWPHSSADAPDDGWTVPDAATDHRVAVATDSPAAFKGSGGAAPLRGAPEGEDDATAPQVDAEAADDATAPRRDAAEEGGTARPEPSVDRRGTGADGVDDGRDMPLSTDGTGRVLAQAPAPPEPSPIDAAALAAAPGSLDAPRDGLPDDLTRIAGIGPSIERLLFSQGIFHFGQIAAWNADDVRWADRLTGFDGRADREKWVEQAKRLEAEAGE